MDSVVFVILFLAAILSLVGCQSFSCPATYQRFCRAHTYCLPRKPSCSIITNEVSRRDIDEILHLHNKVRSRIALGQVMNMPPAGDMLEMEWSPELAAVAQSHAEQCRFGHDAKECRQIGSFSVGQNVATVSSSAPLLRANWKAAIKMWYDEAEEFDGRSVRFYRHQDRTGHFAQMAWSKTWKIGCGYVAFKSSAYMFDQLYVCNYGPGGNTIGEEMYKTGRACSSCPSNSACVARDYPGLCVVRRGRIPRDVSNADHRLIYRCDFEKDRDCHLKEMGNWELVDTPFESFLGTIMKSGESASLVFAGNLVATEMMCFSVEVFKGAMVAGDRDDGDIYFNFQGLYSTLSSVRSTSRNRINIEVRSFLDKLKFGITASVPRGSPAQFFQISEITVRDGSCSK